MREGTDEIGVECCPPTGADVDDTRGSHFGSSFPSGPCCLVVAMATTEPTDVVRAGPREDTMAVEIGPYVEGSVTTDLITPTVFSPTVVGDWFRTPAGVGDWFLLTMVVGDWFLGRVDTTLTLAPLLTLTSVMAVVEA